MQRFLQIAAVLAAVLPAALAFGHGHPIIVTAPDDRLIVSGGVADTGDGFVDQMFVEQDSSGDAEDLFDFDGFGPAIYWTVPGFQISGLDENSGLYLQVLARAVKNSNPVEQRAFWYWKPISDGGEVQVAPPSSKMQIWKSETVNIPLTPTTTVAPPSIKIADPVLADMNHHNHVLVTYLLPAPPAPDPPTPDGAYAFFARLTSDDYAPSDPFLVVINNGGLSGAKMIEAATEINAAAALQGDFNHDGKVDAADYVMWRTTIGTSPKYDEWRSNFGMSDSGTGSFLDGLPEFGGAAASVPEPAVASLAAIAVFGWAIIRGPSRRVYRGIT